MKRLLILLTFISISFVSFASHLLGGTITWKCLSNGEYVFKMELYRDCSGIQFNYTETKLEVVGSPLPTNNMGLVIDTIRLIPDSSRWRATNFGDLSPECDTSIGTRFSCANNNNGAVQIFYYKSAPITLNGTPPSSGWAIYWQAPCCRPFDIENLNTSGSLLLRAVMYSGPNGISANPCIDSSPEFRALPVTAICRGQEVSFNHTAIDLDLDSLQYSWDRPYNAPISNPVPLTYKGGFSPWNPTPDQNININNVRSTLDPWGGIIKMRIHSGIGTEKYLTVVRVDAYRNGQRIASVFREMPIAVFDCPDLPGNPGVQNKVPSVLIDGRLGNKTTRSITAGRTVSIPIQFIDNDRINVAPFSQILTMVPDGGLFTKTKTGPDRPDTTNGIADPCEIPGTSPCAYLRNSTPVVDSSLIISVPAIKGLGIIGTEFMWQTDCKHIQSNTGFPGTNEGIYNFVMRVQDDHCPIPAINYPTLTIRLRDPFPLTEPIIKGISVQLDGSVTYSWVPPIDSGNQFKKTFPDDDHYEVYSSTVSNGQAPTNYMALNTNLKKYKQDFNSTSFSPYALNNPFDPNSGYNILQLENANSDYYMRMRTLSGCTDTNASIWSTPGRIMELDVSPSGVNNSRDTVLLIWNRAKPITAKTYPYFKYESPTYFYIYANDSISNGGVADSSNWYLTGCTMDTNLLVSTSNCADYSAYRVEARDTIITLKGGSAQENSRYFTGFDTLYFSTYSTIDSIFTTGGAPSVLNIEHRYLQSSLKRKSFQWIDCTTNQAIPGANQRIFVPISPGFYKVSSNNLGCADTSSCFEVTPVLDSIISRGTIDLQAVTNGTIINWINCVDSSVVSGDSSVFVPTAPGSYAIKVKKFGFDGISNCIETLAINDSVSQRGLDFFEAVDSTVRYQWFKRSGSTNQLQLNERGRRFIPQSPGDYYANLTKYGYSANSEAVLATGLNKTVTVLSNSELQSNDVGKKFQWIDCNLNSPIAGEVNRNIILTDTGLFRVVVSAFNYSVTSPCYIMRAVGLPENTFQSQLNYYPNPTNGLVQIDFQQVQQNVAVEVYSIQGKLVQNQRIQNSESFKIELKQPAGIYFIQLINGKGERANLKIVKS